MITKYEMINYHKSSHKHRIIEQAEVNESDFRFKTARDLSKGGPFGDISIWLPGVAKKSPRVAHYKSDLATVRLL